MIVSSILLMGMGALFLLMQILRKGHKHEHDMNRLAIVALILIRQPHIWHARVSQGRLDSGFVQAPATRGRTGSGGGAPPPVSS